MTFFQFYLKFQKLSLIMSPCQNMPKMLKKGFFFVKRDWDRSSNKWMVSCKFNFMDDIICGQTLLNLLFLPYRFWQIFLFVNSNQIAFSGILFHILRIEKLYLTFTNFVCVCVYTLKNNWMEKVSISSQLKNIFFFTFFVEKEFLKVRIKKFVVHTLLQKLQLN